MKSRAVLGLPPDSPVRLAAAAGGEEGGGAKVGAGGQAGQEGAGGCTATLRWRPAGRRGVGPNLSVATELGQTFAGLRLALRFKSWKKGGSGAGDTLYVGGRTRQLLQHRVCGCGPPPCTWQQPAGGMDSLYPHLEAIVRKEALRQGPGLWC